MRKEEKIHKYFEKLGIEIPIEILSLMYDFEMAIATIPERRLNKLLKKYPILKEVN